MHWPKLLTTAQALEYSGLTLVELDALAELSEIKFIIPLKEKRKFLKSSIDDYFKRETGESNGS
tara:strand:- start:53 stop:244 length:192 start_codon:yes stop_codon:yes gene_type:complete